MNPTPHNFSFCGILYSLISFSLFLPASLPLLSQDAYARGEVFIGSKENSYTVLPGLPPSTQGYHWNHGITIVTPDRKFLFACETEAEQKDWITAFQRVINRPMRPQEYAGKSVRCIIQVYSKVCTRLGVLKSMHLCRCCVFAVMFAGYVQHPI